MPGEPTLLDDLDAEAKWADQLMAADGRTLKIIIEPSYRERAARLRAAAARLREEMERARGTLCDGWLERVNNGPLPVAPPVTCGTCGGSGWKDGPIAHHKTRCHVCVDPPGCMSWCGTDDWPGDEGSHEGVWLATWWDRRLSRREGFCSEACLDEGRPGPR